jgi:hypothetical protein
LAAKPKAPIGTRTPFSTNSNPETLNSDAATSPTAPLLSEHDDPTPRFAFRFYVPGLLRWSGVYLGVCLGIVFVLPYGPDISLKTALLVIAAGLFIGVIAWHVRLAYSAVSHWRLLKRILNWGTIHRLCELHDAEVELNHEPSK